MYRFRGTDAVAVACDDDDETSEGGLACAIKRIRSHDISLGVDNGLVAEGIAVDGIPVDIPVPVDGIMTDVELLSFVVLLSSPTDCRPSLLICIIVVCSIPNGDNACRITSFLYAAIAIDDTVFAPLTMGTDKQVQKHRIAMLLIDGVVDLPQQPIQIIPRK